MHLYFAVNVVTLALGLVKEESKGEQMVIPGMCDLRNVCDEACIEIKYISLFLYKHFYRVLFLYKMG